MMMERHPEMLTAERLAWTKRRRGMGVVKRRGLQQTGRNLARVHTV